MAHYLLSVYTPADGTPPSPDELAVIMKRVDDFHQELHAAGSWVFAGGLAGPATATVVRATDDEVLLTDGPFLEGKEYLGGLAIDRGRGPGRRAGLGPPLRRGDDAAHRGAALPADALASRHRADLPGRARPRGGRPRPRLRRHRPRRGVRAGGVRDGGRALARRGRAARPRRAGSSRRPATGRSTGCAARPSATTATPRRAGCTARRDPARGGSRARRPAAADLHLLPSRARARRQGRAHPAPAGRPRRPPRSPARSSSPSRRWRSGSCGPRPRSATRASRTACRTTPTCPSGCAPCSPCVYLIFNEGYTASTGAALVRDDLCAEAIRLGRLLAELMPDEPEVLGLLALMLLVESRRPARTAPDGTLVPLAEQDPSRWDARPGRRGPHPRPAVPAARAARPVPGAGGDPGRPQ